MSFYSCFCLNVRIKGAKLKAAFDKAVKAWSKDTCIEFKKDASAHDRVRIITNANGCESRVGKNGGEQPLYLGNGCDTFDNVAHELGHTLGLLHTMSRYDRDEYVSMQEWNIKVNLINTVKDVGFHLLFKLQPDLLKSEYKIIPIEYNENYDTNNDYGSIMQYKWKSIAPNYTQGTFFSEKCNDKNPAKCANGGFPHPRECSKCVCPSGYGGDLCDRRVIIEHKHASSNNSTIFQPADACGSELKAEPHWKTLTDLIMNVRAEEYLDGYEKCHYWIKVRINEIEMD
ncbi:astacin [Ancylostoma duodenale]|uniref:Metalloendopeptidase n=1 Tax=Ancylostoma duodenale TaxID=51022 RepID=A0A0C2GYJ0_9BILA|nr:astacin [Ancylostoma duodenale]